MTESGNQSGDRNGEGGGPSLDPFATDRSRISIPPLASIPETKEERQRRLLIRAATIVAIVVVIAVLSVITISFRNSAQLQDAALDAENDGRLASLEVASELLDGDGDYEDIALHARLLAAATLDHGLNKADKARELLGELDSEEVPMNALIASAYLALAAGDLQTAQQTASSIVVAGPYASEAARARSLTALGLGNLDAASEAAHAAVENREGAPRHAALLALVLARMGKTDEALAAIDGLENGDASPAVRLARARVLLMGWQSLDRANSEADAVLGASDATPAEKAWAHLVKGKIAASQGRWDEARKEMEAVEGRRALDWWFAISAAEALVDAGAGDLARAELERAAAAAAPDLAVRRAQTQAAIFLLAGDLGRAEQVLANLPDLARTSLLRGQVALLRGQGEEARALLGRAQGDKSLERSARTSLARLDLSAGDPAAAVAQLGPVLEEYPAHPDTVDVGVRSHLAANDVPSAMGVVTRALSLIANEPRLIAVRALVELAKEDWQAAETSLRTALRSLPEIAELHANLGIALRHMDRAEEARQAFGKAVELSAHHEVALLNGLELAVLANDGEGATPLANAIAEADLQSDDLRRAQALYFVLVGAGQAGARTVRQFMRLTAHDSELYISLGWLLFQSGDYRGAAGAFVRASRIDPGNPHALLGKASAQARLGARGTAEKNVESAREAAAEREVDDAFRADLAAVEGRLHLLERRIHQATRAARQALELDPTSSEAHLVLADISASRSADPSQHLRAALTGRPAAPEAAARLFLGDPRLEDACALARRFLSAAPRARVSGAVRVQSRGCR